MVNHATNQAPSTGAAIFYSAGLEARNRQDMTTAKVLWKQAVACDDATSQHHASFANLLTKQGDIFEATPHWERAHTLAPQNAAFANGLGASLLSEKRPAEAMAYFQKAQSLNAGNAIYQENIAQCRQALQAGGSQGARPSRPAPAPKPAPTPAPQRSQPAAGGARPAYAHLSERLRAGPPVSPATLGPCRVDALFTHRQLTERPKNYPQVLAAYGMSKPHYDQLISWLDAEAKYKFRTKLASTLAWTPAALLTYGAAFMWMFQQRENYATKSMEQVCNAVSSEYEPYGITLKFQGKSFTEGCSYVLEAQGNLWRDIGRDAG